MKNNGNDNEKFLKNLIERKSREQLIDNYKAIKSYPAEFHIAMPVVFTVGLLITTIFPSIAHDSFNPLFVIATALVISISASLFAAHKKLDILFALEQEKDQPSREEIDREILQRFLQQQKEENEFR